MDFLSANSRFAVQNGRTYLQQITRETFTWLRLLHFALSSWWNWRFVCPNIFCCSLRGKGLRAIVGNKKWHFRLPAYLLWHGKKQSMKIPPLLYFTPRGKKWTNKTWPYDKRFSAKENKFLDIHFCCSFCLLERKERERGFLRL